MSVGPGLAPAPPRATAAHRRTTLLACGSVALLVAVVVLVATRVVPPTAPPATPQLPQLASGSPAPHFSAPRLGGGSPVALPEGIHPPVVVTFSASWCLTCAGVLATVARGAEHYGARVDFLAVDCADRALTAAQVASIPHRLTVGLDPNGAIQRQYRIDALPATVFISADGRVRREVFGPLSPSVLTVELARLGVEAEPGSPGT